MNTHQPRAALALRLPQVAGLVALGRGEQVVHHLLRGEHLGRLHGGREQVCFKKKAAACVAVGTQSRQGCWASGSVRSVRSSDSSAPLLASGRNSRCTHSRCTPPPSETRRHMLLRTWVREMPPLPAGEPPSLPWPSPASPLPSPSAQGGWEDGSGVVSNTRRNQYIGISAFKLAFSRQLPGQKPQSHTAKHAPPHHAPDSLPSAARPPTEAASRASSSCCSLPCTRLWASKGR